MVLGTLPASAQVRPDSLPPLPDTLRLYGADLPVRLDVPELAPPPDARLVTLEEAVRLALARNPDRLISALEAERAANDATRHNAGYYPDVDFNSRLGGNRSGPATTTGSDGTVRRNMGSTSLSSDVTLGYTVFDGNRRAATYRRLRAERTRAVYDADADAEALVRDVIGAYLNVVREQGLEDAREQAVRVSEDRLRVQEARVRIGTAADVDAGLALADLNADRAALLRERIALQQARLFLGELLALDDPSAVAVAERDVLTTPDATGATELSAEAVAAAAEARNRALRVSEASETSAREVVREVRAEYLPSVRLTAGYGATASDRGILPELEPSLTGSLNYGLSLTWPLYDARDRDRRLANANLRVEQAELVSERVRTALRSDAVRLAGDVDAYQRLAALETQNAAIARRNVEVALAQLEQGQISPLDLRQVQLAALDADTRLVDARYRLRLAEAELRLLTGTLLPPDAALAE